VPNTLAVASATVLLATTVGYAWRDALSAAGATGGSATAARAGGSLDPSFSGNGILTRDFGYRDEASSVTVVSNGAILVGAFAGRREEGTGDNVVLGYRADGTPDASFGQNGVLRATAAGSVVEQPDGKLLLLGSTSTGVVIGRTSRDGSPDRSFGQDGVGVIARNMLGSPDCLGSPAGAALTRDGRILFTGATGCGGEDGGELGIYVARLLADGRLDRSFGRAGVWTSRRACDAAGVAIQTSGRIVVAASTGNTDYCTSGSMLLTRLRADGALDRTFGDRGRRLVRFPGSDSAGVNALATDHRGRLHIAGWASNRFAVARVLPDGTLDRTFGRDGRVTRRATTAEARETLGATGVTVGGDGGVTVSGALQTETRSRFALLRFRRDGRLDRSFAPDGIRVISFGSNIEGASDVTLDRQGRAIAVGWTVRRADLDIAIARVR
jgi:uncharacterized delta-60 repeat protein